MMLLLIRLTSLVMLLLDTKVKTLFGLPMLLLEFLTLRLIRRCVMILMRRSRALRRRQTT
ncbi:hypothetical protein ANAPC1_01167 [Anaplasma phagocytophilum]|uniref:Uncharacterized protein n=1 Tax=Anaplasma phagocytophilum TaxID=948 RepID=A0AA45UTN9_ANAPH|nr:hypothetical protein ANAPC1_01167 [Anaplasma phagocytophilum]